MSTFEQILDMDDEEDDKEFSKGIVYGFLEQAEQTFDKMDASLYSPARSSSLTPPLC
jgi:osomolarity two-component system, phosphorelay intermediate protein YPD1